MEELEQRVKELVEENREGLEQRAEEAERSSAIRAELQKLGVAKIDLAYKAVKDEVTERRTADGAGRSGNAGVSEAVRRARIRSCCRRGWREGRGQAAGQRERRGDGWGGYRHDPAGDERGRDGTGEAGDREGGVADAARVVRKSEGEEMGAITSSKCSDRDCEAGGGGCAAGVDGEPCHGQPGQSRL